MSKEQSTYTCTHHLDCLRIGREFNIELTCCSIPHLCRPCLLRKLVGIALNRADQALVGDDGDFEDFLSERFVITLSCACTSFDRFSDALSFPISCLNCRWFGIIIVVIQRSSVVVRGVAGEGCAGWACRIKIAVVRRIRIMLIVVAIFVIERVVAIVLERFSTGVFFIDFAVVGGPSIHIECCIAYEQIICAMNDLLLWIIFRQCICCCDSTRAGLGCVVIEGSGAVVRAAVPVVICN